MVSNHRMAPDTGRTVYFQNSARAPASTSASGNLPMQRMAVFDPSPIPDPRSRTRRVLIVLAWTAGVVAVLVILKLILGPIGFWLAIGAAEP